MTTRPTLREQYEDLRERHEPLLRAALRAVAAFDPSDPNEVATLIHELGLAAGVSGQLEAVAIVQGEWRTPVRSSHHGETMTACYPMRRT